MGHSGRFLGEQILKDDESTVQKNPLKKTHQRIKIGISVQRRSARALSFSSKTFDYAQLFLKFAFYFSLLMFCCQSFVKNSVLFLEAALGFDKNDDI